MQRNYECRQIPLCLACTRNRSEHRGLRLPFPSHHSSITFLSRPLPVSSSFSFHFSILHFPSPLATPSLPLPLPFRFFPLFPATFALYCYDLGRGLRLEQDYNPKGTSTWLALTRTVSLSLKLSKSLAPCCQTIQHSQFSFMLFVKQIYLLRINFRPKVTLTFPAFPFISLSSPFSFHFPILPFPSPLHYFFSSLFHTLLLEVGST